MKLVSYCAIFLALLGASLMLSSPAHSERPADDHAVILLYHHVSKDTPASTSVSPAVFESHLDYLDENGYSVLPLADIVSALQNKVPLPHRSVAITFDDAYRSILSEAMPRLARRNWPFTVFVSTDAIDEGYANFMSWPDLKRIEANGGSIANHTQTHNHLVRREPDESAATWRKRVTADIRLAQAKLEKALDHPEHLLAWPYGEFDVGLEALAVELGYVAFGQQSGPAGYGSSLQSLPRFPMATAFADLAGFADKLRSRPLPVTVLAPDSRVLNIPAQAPSLQMRIPEGPYRIADLRCYVAGQEPAQLKWRDDVVTVTAQKFLQPGRNKFNCTVPSLEESGVFYWYSHLWMQPRNDSSWYTE